MVKIALLGAAGQIGTPLSLLCKTSDLFDEISLYDLVHVPGIATDLVHIDTRASVTRYLAEYSGLKKTLPVPILLSLLPALLESQIVKSKQGAGSATTCMAYAGSRFGQVILKAKNGESVVQKAYVYLPGISGGKEIAAGLGVDYFAVKVELGKQGAVKALPIGKISDNETKLLDIALADLRKNIWTALDFMLS